VDKRDLRFSELLRHITEHPAQDSINRWNALERIHRVYLANQSDLLRIIDLPNAHKELGIALFREEAEREVYFDELYRMIHNYLSMLASLIDHSRNLLKKYESSSTQVEYKRRTDSMSRIGEAKFLKDLRNYLLHVRIPPMVLHFAMTPGPSRFDFGVRLDVEELLKYSNWSSVAKSYLRGREVVILKECVVSYTDAIQGLYDWLFDQFEEIHGGEVADLHALQDEAYSLYDWPEDIDPRK